MFGRATIRLGIGPRSSCFLNFSVGILSTSLLIYAHVSASCQVWYQWTIYLKMLYAVWYHVHCTQIFKKCCFIEKPLRAFFVGPCCAYTQGDNDVSRVQLASD